jgi:hypothetical protein
LLGLKFSAVETAVVHLYLSHLYITIAQTEYVDDELYSLAIAVSLADISNHS